MKPKTLVASILIVLGIAAFLYQGIILMSGGPELGILTMHVTTGRTHAIPLLPVFGAIALIGGIAWLLVDKNDFKPTVMP